MDFGLAQKAPLPLKGSPTNIGELTLKDVSKQYTHQATPLPPRRTRRQADGNVSPKKRKINDVDAENFPESPRKRKSCNEKERGLAIVDLNTRKSALPSTSASTKDKDASCTETERRKSLTPTPATATDLFKSTYDKTKSPRRMLLTKRALDLSRGGALLTSKAGAGVRKTSVVVQQNGGRSMYKTVEVSTCQCFAQPMICNICIAR